MSSDSPAAILFDELGNPVGVIYDGVIYRLQTQTIITDPAGHGPAAVKPPSTPAVATDPALVVAISPNNSFTASPPKSSTSITSSVAAATSSVTLLASNSNRLGATIFNDSSQFLYVKLGTTASVTDYTIKLFPAGYYEVPFGFTGEIDGIWAGTGGFARVDELTP